MPTGSYKKNKEGLRKEVCERYQNLSEGERNKKGNEAQERHQNLSEEEKIVSVSS